MTYTVHAAWEPDMSCWSLSVPDVPGTFSQCTRLDQAAENAAEALEVMTGKDIAPSDLTVEWAVPGELGTVAERTAELRKRAAEIEWEAEQESRRAVSELRSAGFSYRDIGRMIGMSYQRAQQIDAELARS